MKRIHVLMALVAILVIGGATTALATITPPSIDYCDASNKPGGISLADWLAQNGNPDCIDIQVDTYCGSVVGTISRNETKWNWAVAFEIAPATYDLNTAEYNLMIFDEDHNGGSVKVAYYLVGPEADYGKISGEPNFWMQDAETVTINTDCTQPSTTTTVADSTTTVADSTTTTDETSSTVIVTTVPPTTEETLPFTGIEDFYLPSAIALVAAGGLILAFSRRPDEN